MLFLWNWECCEAPLWLCVVKFRIFRLFDTIAYFSIPLHRSVVQTLIYDKTYHILESEKLSGEKLSEIEEATFSRNTLWLSIFLATTKKRFCAPGNDFTRLGLRTTWV